MPLVRLAWDAVPPGSDRREVAWALIRSLAGADVRIANPCPRCGGPHGPVVLPESELAAAVAYSGDLAVAAVAGPGVAALGVDAEPADRAAPVLGPPGAAPAAALRRWVRIEAVLKADGRALSVDPADVRVAPDAAGTLSGRVRSGSAPYLVQDLPGPPGHIVSAALALAPRRR